MIIGCFALIEPFSPLRRQFQLVHELGLKHIDLTDNHDGATLGTEYGFAASASLDAHPSIIRGMCEEFDLTLTSVCAHANLIDPPSPDRYGTLELIKAIRLAGLLGVKQVITTEGEPHTEFGISLDRKQRIFAIREKLDEPIRWARELGIDLLLEPHGELTDTVNGMSDLLESLGNDDVIGINLDTGNSWLGGGDPLEFIRTFTSRIKHVHWKDMGAEWEPKRGTLFGCGMGSIPLGDGIIGIEAIVTALNQIGFDGPTTLEVAGSDNVQESIQRLRQWSQSCVPSVS
ncbi:sugar phosphate isomerase/epimerase family protein [Planctomycetes bacterium CA13]|uniref:sugar phosphate isomerase/epimerase family protein n=1 Tax=Novipirellula herctigrandis TaxID=2527986 RepID=UPI0011B67C00